MSKCLVLPALRGIIGKWVYYSCLMKMQDAAKLISYAEEIHTNKNLSDMIQRQLSSGRDKQISNYLINDEERFFNSLVVATYDGSPSWLGLEHITSLPNGVDQEEISSDIESSVGFLRFSGKEKLFALDGQHRLSGIKSALKKKQDLALDEISIILLAHSTDKAGLIRSRKLFTNLNKHAKPVTTPEIIALDESDAMAIITRRLVEDCPYFSENRVKFKGDQITLADETEFTTIVTLYKVLQQLFTGILFDEKLSNLKLYRPSDETLDCYYNGAVNFFDDLARAFPPLKEYFNTDHCNKAIAKYRTSDGGHLLFRPVGLQLVVEVLLALRAEGKTLEEALKLIRLIPTNFNHAMYLDVIWDSKKKSPYLKGKALCRDLLLYVLDVKMDKKKLLSRLAKIIGQEEKDCELPEKLLTTG